MQLMLNQGFNKLHYDLTQNWREKKQQKNSSMRWNVLTCLGRMIANSSSYAPGVKLCVKVLNLAAFFSIMFLLPKLLTEGLSMSTYKPIVLVNSLCIISVR